VSVVRLEFAHGSVRDLRTGADGTVFVDGLNPGGPAAITLTDRDEPGDAEAPLPADTFEPQFVDETGEGFPKSTQRLDLASEHLRDHGARCYPSRVTPQARQSRVKTEEALSVMGLRVVRILRGVGVCAPLGLMACRAGSDSMRAPMNATTRGVEVSPAATGAGGSTNAPDAPPQQDGGKSSLASSDTPCGRKPRVTPTNPPGGRLGAGRLICPPGLIEIPGGFLRMHKARWMENSKDERFLDPEELIPQPSFCLGETEVTRAAMRQSTDAAEGAFPAEVDYKTAAAYCKARGLRLPSQGEWRFAAVAATDFMFPWGDEIPTDGVCWLRGPTSAPCAVGTSLHDVTPDGVRDLGGNVHEWVYLPSVLEGWIPYEAMGAAHDSDCSALISSDYQFNRISGGGNTAPGRAGFRCAANGRPRASSQPARKGP